jgi:alpha-N-acetylglucosaminidase
VLADLDGLLDTRPELRLRTWEEAAAAWAADDAERALLRDNARRIVSVWTTPEHAQLTVYSARPWSGLVGGFYRERWRCWIDGLAAALAAGAEPDEDGLRAALAACSHRFLRDGAVARTSAPASTVAAARRLLERYVDPRMSVREPITAPLHRSSAPD